MKYDTDKTKRLIILIVSAHILLWIPSIISYFKSGYFLETPHGTGIIIALLCVILVNLR